MAALVLALLLGVTLCTAASPKDVGFDLFVLVRSYSPTFCQEESCTINPV